MKDRNDSFNVLKQAKALMRIKYQLFYKQVKEEKVVLQSMILNMEQS